MVPPRRPSRLALPALSALAWLLPPPLLLLLLAQPLLATASYHRSSRLDNDDLLLELDKPSKLILGHGP